MIHCAPNGFAHVAGSDGLHTGVIRQNTGNHAAGALGSLHAAQDDDDLRHQVQHIVIEQKQIVIDHNGDEQQHDPHGNNRPKHTKALDHKGGRPLLHLSALVQGQRRDTGRCNQIQQQQVEDTGYTVDNDDRVIPDQFKCHRDQHNEVDLTDLKISKDALPVVNALLAGIIRPPQLIPHSGRVIERGILRGIHGAHQEDQAVQRHLTAIGDILSLIRLQRRKGAVLLHRLHQRHDGICNARVIDIQLEVPAQIRRVDDLLQL